MKTLALLFICLVVPAVAAPKPEPTYQDAVLKSFHMATDGTSCRTDISEQSGTNTASADTTCSAKKNGYYTVALGDQLLTITPAMSGKQSVGSTLSLGYSSMFAKKSSLYGVLPNTPIQIRQDEPGKYFVKVGKRETLYKLSAAE